MQSTKRLARSLFALAVLAGLGLLAGCPQPVGPGPGDATLNGNGADTTDATGGTAGGTSTGGSTGTGDLTASAGPDQTVEDAVTVTLAGTATDATGAPVTFLWTQISGPTVTLAGGDTAAPTFTAPDASATLVFNLLAASTGGQVNDQVTITVRPVPILFVANRAASSIARFRAAPTLNGDVAPLGAIAGTAALSGPSSLVLDRAGGILAVNASGNSIAGFPNAASFDGVVPDREVKGPATRLDQPEGAAYDPANDLLFVANFNSVPSEVTVYGNASTTALTGDKAPTRRFSSAGGITNPRALVLASTGELYVVNAGSNNIAVFPNAGLLNGSIPAAAVRLITSTEMDGRVLTDAFLDRAGNLLVVDNTGKRVLIFANALGLGADSVPVGILTPTGAGTVTGIVVDSGGTGYLSDSNANAIYIYENIAARSGTLAPDRTLAGANTQLSEPGHMAVLQR